MTAYITKAALAKGIRKIEIDEDLSSHYAVFDTNSKRYHYYPHFHYSLDDAIIKAESMRYEKIALLKRQIKKLEDMKFEVNTGSEDDL